jgi:hypothetical protein
VYSSTNFNDRSGAGWIIENVIAPKRKFSRVRIRDDYDLEEDEVVRIRYKDIAICMASLFRMDEGKDELMEDRALFCRFVHHMVSPHMGVKSEEESEEERQIVGVGCPICTHHGPIRVDDDERFNPSTVKKQNLKYAIVYDSNMKSKKVLAYPQLFEGFITWSKTHGGDVGLALGVHNSFKYEHFHSAIKDNIIVYLLFTKWLTKSSKLYKYVPVNRFTNDMCLRLATMYQAAIRHAVSRDCKSNRVDTELIDQYLRYYNHTDDQLSKLVEDNPFARAIFRLFTTVYNNRTVYLDDELITVFKRYRDVGYNESWSMICKVISRFDDVIEFVDDSYSKCLPNDTHSPIVELDEDTRRLLTEKVRADSFVIGAINMNGVVPDICDVMYYHWLESSGKYTPKNIASLKIDRYIQYSEDVIEEDYAFNLYSTKVKYLSYCDVVHINPIEDWELSSMCDYCGKLGHLEDTCRRKKDQHNTETGIIIPDCKFCKEVHKLGGCSNYCSDCRMRNHNNKTCRKNKKQSYKKDDNYRKFRGDPKSINNWEKRINKQRKRQNVNKQPNRREEERKRNMRLKKIDRKKRELEEQKEIERINLVKQIGTMSPVVLTDVSVMLRNAHAFTKDSIERHFSGLDALDRYPEELQIELITRLNSIYNVGANALPYIVSFKKINEISKFLK